LDANWFGQEAALLSDVVEMRLLAAVFRLADELECPADRLYGLQGALTDPRKWIASVDVDIESWQIMLTFHYGAPTDAVQRCMRHLKQFMKRVDGVLSAHGLSFAVRRTGAGVRLAKPSPEESREQPVARECTSSPKGIGKLLVRKRSWRDISAEVQNARLGALGGIITQLRERKVGNA
jgi:hypothetical protein